MNGQTLPLPQERASTRGHSPLLLRDKYQILERISPRSGPLREVWRLWCSPNLSGSSGHTADCHRSWTDPTLSNATAKFTVPGLLVTPASGMAPSRIMAASSFFLSLGNLPVLVGGLVAASLAWYVASAAATWFRLRRVPGPFLASFSSSWGVFKVAQAQMHRTVAELNSRYGPLVRIGPNELLLSDAATLWRMNAARSPYSRGAWYSVMKMDPYGHNIFSEPDNTVHDKRKAVLAGGFAGRGRMNFERDVDSLLAILVRLLKTKYVCNDGTKVLDLGQVMRYFTIDVTSLVGFGEAWGDLENERDTFNYLSALDGFGPAMLCISMAPILRRIFSSSLFLRLAGPKHTDETGMGRILGQVHP